MISKTCKYGLRAAIYLAIRDYSEVIPIQEISQDLNIPFHFLTKTLQRLTRNKILVSTKGPKGGVRLAKPPQNITTMEVILAVDGSDIFEICLLGLPGCGVLNPCPLHESWTQTLENLKKSLNTTTLEILAKKVKNNQLRITDANSPEFLNNLIK